MDIYTLNRNFHPLFMSIPSILVIVMKLLCLSGID